MKFVFVALASLLPAVAYPIGEAGDTDWPKGATTEVQLRLSAAVGTATTARFIYFAAFLLTTRFETAAQNHFSDAETNGINVFLRDNFRETNACLVIGLVDEHGSR